MNQLIEGMLAVGSGLPPDDGPRLVVYRVAALVYAGLAITVFNLGLRRYESGNRFGVRT